jgi:hypothetical protein
MRCTPELLKKIQDAIESIEFGTVRVTVNEKGNYTEICIEKKDRISKVSATPFHEG